MENLKSHLLFKKYKKVKTVCAPLYKLGISGFIYMRRYPNGTFIDLANQIEWGSFFLEKYLNGQYPIEAVEDHMLSERGVLLWNMEPHNLIWQEGEKIFGFGNGISIYKKKYEYCEIFCFYGKKEDDYLNKFFVQSLFLLEKFLKYFTENMAPDIDAAYENNDVLIVPQIYLCPKRETLPQTNEKQFLQALKLPKKSFTFSPRERECLYLISIGKTAKEVARAINLSPRTIEGYLINAKQKSGSKNLKDLIYKFAHETDEFSD